MIRYPGDDVDDVRLLTEVVVAELLAAELERLQGQITEARARAEKATQDFHALETQVAGLDEGEVGLDEEHEHCAVIAANALHNAVTDALHNLNEPWKRLYRT